MALSFFCELGGATEGVGGCGGCDATQAGVIPARKTFKTKPGWPSRALYTERPRSGRQSGIHYCQKYDLVRIINAPADSYLFARSYRGYVCLSIL